MGIEIDQNTFILMYSSKGEEWWTPLDLYRKLNNEFHFTTDPCAEPSNRLGCPVFYTKKDDGLYKEWKGNCFVNPPYGKKVSKWVARCASYAASGAGIVVMLIPARTDTSWFHEYIWQKDNVEVRFIRGRLRFENPEHKLNTAPFPSMVVVFYNEPRCLRCSKLQSEKKVLGIFEDVDSHEFVHFCADCYNRLVVTHSSSSS